MDLEYAINCALEGNAILFAGSGFSHGALNVNRCPIKSGSTLNEALARECNVDANKYNLSTLSEYFLKVKSEEELIELIKRECTVTSVCQYHKVISSLPWKRIYTTNYDSVIEQSASDCLKNLTPIVFSDEIKNTDKKMYAFILMVILKG